MMAKMQQMAHIWSPLLRVFAVENWNSLIHFLELLLVFRVEKLND
jgi:hypothetical protein